MKKKSSTVLRELINADEILFRAGIAIAIQGLIAERLGFKAVGVSGSNFSSQVLGLPDAGLSTMTEVVENVRRICGVIDIPVMADCDSGFGSAVNVRRTVKEMIRAGAAGIYFNDQEFPPRCGFTKGKQIISLEEAAGKYRAAVDQRNEMDTDFVIVARIEARTAAGGGLDEVIRRCHAFHAEGVDVLYIEALQSRDEIEQVRAAVEGPLCCSVHALDPLPTLQELQDLGMCMTLGSQAYKAGTVATWDIMSDMMQRGLAPYNEFMARSKTHPLGGYGAFDLTGFPEIIEWEQRYLPASELAKYDDSIGLYDPRNRTSLALKKRS